MPTEYKLSGDVDLLLVFDERMYHGNGIVRLWCEKITKRFEIEATARAPVRDGILKAGIASSVDTIGVRQVMGTIVSLAPYTLFVLRGTESPIMSNLAWAAGGLLPEGPRKEWPRGTFMGPMPPFGGHTAVYRHQVSGQQANNFFLKAWRATARRHSAIRGIAVPRFIEHPELFPRRRLR